MSRRLRLWRTGAVVVLLLLVGLIAFLSLRGAQAANAVLANAARAPLVQRLESAGFHKGDAVFVRIFKRESRLELWLRKDGRYRLFDTYPICRWSGVLGPKLKEGDGQSPEGFYSVRPAQMKPDSRYHRAFNLDFPNAYDQANGRTGSFLMVHGSCLSIGCYAMTDPAIKEIYGLMEAAFEKGQREIAVDVLPFSMNADALKDEKSNPWEPFWRSLAEGDLIFRQTGHPASAYVCGKAYRFSPLPGCRPIRVTGTA